MDPRSEHSGPADLDRVEELLRAKRPQADAVELDRAKLRAITQASREGSTSRRRLTGTSFGRSRRILGVALVVAMFGGGTVFAATGGFSASSSPTSASKVQYCPPTSQSGGGTKGKSCGKQ